ncbi:putative subtilisin-like proteinase 1 [Astathelohania contejeani]|uniref:Subtilisin-like proteinase 1 n=1 Tax=Astathelohania contejeani TaxID=164912 RepID=A0ABQ7I110_9MICR|nr:putative subtilisin-like proteinase 1 [Thelohania contejeani]
MLLLFIANILSYHKSQETNQYIVIFRRPDNVKEDADMEQKIYAANYTRIASLLTKDDKVTKRFTNGYIGKFTRKTTKMFEEDPSVAIVEKDTSISIQNEFKVYDEIPFISYYLEMTTPVEEEYMGIGIQHNATWGLSRISSGKKYNGNDIFEYPKSAGQNVNVYVIDTGVDVSHPEFEGRAKWGVNLVEDSPDTDENGHGTHCAGVIAGKTTGISKKSQIIAVKSLDKDGQGLISRVILGLDYVIRDHSRRTNVMNNSLKEWFLNSKKHKMKNIYSESEKKDGKVKRKNSHFMKLLSEYLEIEEIKPKSIVNMSVGGIQSRALDFAIQYAKDLGIHFAVAAGNDHEDACEYSPGSSRDVMTVGASTREDKVARFSNYGECVDLFAPGVDILSTWKEGQFRVTTGTSMASPHVAGAMALYLGEGHYKPNELIEQMKHDSLNIIDEDDEDDSIFNHWPFKELLFKEENHLPLVSIKNLLNRVKKKSKKELNTNL